MGNFTFLTVDQYFDKELDIIRKKGTKAAITDFAILLGGYVGDTTLDGSSSLEDRTGWYWTRSDDGDNDARAVSRNGYWNYYDVFKRIVAARPALPLPYSSIGAIPTNGVSARDKDGILVVEYGYYPQQAVSRNEQLELDRKLSSGRLRSCSEKITVDSRKYNEYDKPFSPKDYDVFEDNGSKYIRVQANSCFNGSSFKLSNGESYKDGDYVWIKISPVRWLVDEKEKIILSEKLLFAGVQFKNKSDYKGDFDKTDIKKYMDDYFSKNLNISMTTTKISVAEEPVVIQGRKSRLQKLNPDETNPNLRRRMTDTEAIKTWIDAGQSVLLRGPSGIGKTERLKTLYPDLIYIKLTNNMFPEKVVGSMNLQTGQSIPPDYAKQAILSNATEEEKKLITENIQSIFELADQIYERSKDSNKKTVILLDELLNVRPAVQSLVYTLVLNRLVETGKGLKLPANTVVVATGNQKKYSSVAEDLAEPLEKRFDHILDMEPRVSDWISEYAIPNKIHPSVIGYILSKYNENGRSENIGDIGYFYEEPEVGEEHLDRFGCHGRTNDPRGWVSISNTLYSFEEDLAKGKFIGKDVETLFQLSITTKLRDEWAREFYDFYNVPTISVEDVVGNNYTQADLPRDVNERFACVTALLLADENQVGSCREFIRKHCDPEYLQIYDLCWIGNDERRMEIITELQDMSLGQDMAMISEGVGRTR